MKIIIGIVLFKNNLDLLLKNLSMLFLQNIFSSQNILYEIIILDNDNGEQIEQVKTLILSFPNNKNITFLKSENVGFGAGHNKIFNFAKNRAAFNYYLCVNPDGIPHYQMLEYFSKLAPRDKAVANDEVENNAN